MKKVFWIAPAVVFLGALIFIIIWQQKDIDPTSMVHKTDASAVVAKSEAEVIVLLENNRAEYEAAAAGDALPASAISRETDESGCVKFVIAKAFGSYTQYLAYGDAGESLDSLGEQGYNLAGYRRAIDEHWTYCVDYTEELTFSDYYVKRVTSALTSEELAALSDPTLASCSMVLMAKQYAPYPAEYSESACAVVLTANRTDGTVLTAVLDPKTKLLIGFAE